MHDLQKTIPAQVRDKKLGKLKAGHDESTQPRPRV